MSRRLGLTIGKRSPPYNGRTSEQWRLGICWLLQNYHLVRYILISLFLIALKVQGRRDVNYQLSMGTRHEIITAYRHLYQRGLRVVQYAAPERYTLRNRLRDAFREGKDTDFSRTRIANTIEFLKGAAQEIGIEHKIVKTMLFVWYYEKSPSELSKKPRT